VVQDHSLKPRQEIVSCGEEASHEECDGASLCGKNIGTGTFSAALLTSRGSRVQMAATVLFKAGQRL